MNEHAEQWVAALRSGEFGQARGALRMGNRHCCLGVGCELYRRQTGEGEWVFDRGMSRYVFLVHGDERSVTVLPDAVRDWLGLQSAMGAYPRGSLVFLNDGGATFAMIADAIAREPAGLFVGEAS